MGLERVATGVKQSTLDLGLLEQTIKPVYQVQKTTGERGQAGNVSMTQGVCFLPVGHAEETK